MKLTLSNVFTLILITFSGVVGSLIVGLMVYGGNVFNTDSPGFSFLAYGLSGGFIFAFYHVRGLSETITVAVIVSAVQFAISTAWITVLNAGIWSFGVNLAVVVLAFIFERKLAYLHQAKFLAVALWYGAMFVLLTLVVAEISGITQMPAEVFRGNFFDGLFIGLGLGLGIEVGEALIHSIQHHRGTKNMATGKA